MKHLILTSFCLSFITTAIAGCSGSDASAPAQSTDPADPSGSGNGGAGNNTTASATGAAACEAAGKTICARACACATDGKCRIGSEIDGGAVASINFDNDQKCRDWYVTLACYNGGEPGFDYGKCEGAIKAASCVESAGGSAIPSPQECKVRKK